MMMFVKVVIIAAAFAVPSSAWAFESDRDAWNSGYNTAWYYSSAVFKSVFNDEGCSLTAIEEAEQKVADFLLKRMPLVDDKNYIKASYFSGMFDGFVTQNKMSYARYCNGYSNFRTVSENLVAHAAAAILVGLVNNLTFVSANRVTAVLTCDYWFIPDRVSTDAYSCEYDDFIGTGAYEPGQTCAGYIDELAADDGVDSPRLEIAAANAVCIAD